MSVILEGVTKKYGSQIAVNNISFDVKKGQILGFLGPNGAGKTTTMKMVTGYIAPDEGEIEVCGQSVSDDPIALARHIGYLPEHNPLYADMYIQEYLMFIARIHHLNKPKQRIEELIGITGINDERKKKINQLSKGYRQRVGLAQALLNDPEVLILDEPTSGLDPNQLMDIRKLIKDLGQDKSIIFSTHIMQEVKALCDRVIIINKGALIADDSIAALESRIEGETLISVTFQNDIEIAKLQNQFPNCRISKKSSKQFEFASKEDKQLNASVFDFAVSSNNRIIEMYADNLSVEEVFQKLTQTKVVDV